MSETESSDAISFSPPVFKQRYKRVLDVIREFSPKKVVDFGCGECRFIRLLRNENVVEDITGVDIDKSSLERYVDSIRPLATDYLQPRFKPLTIKLFHGSIMDYDERLERVDMVVMIEVIEHLNMDILKQFPKNVFEKIRPQVVVITTPNADFNVLFKTLRHGEFRHWDHKFEWTRIEFNNWCQNVCLNYKYSVTYSGIGSGPKGTEEYGCCSQMAVFLKSASPIDPIVSDIKDSQPYSLIEQSVFPHVNDVKNKKTTIESLLKEVLEINIDHDSLRNTSRNDATETCIKRTYKFNFNKVTVNSDIETNRKPISAPGQFDNAYGDNSVAKEKHLFHPPKVPLPQNKFGRTGFIRYLQAKYFTESNDIVLPGQFEDADMVNGFNNSSDYSYVVGSTLHLPVAVILNLLKVNNVETTTEEIIELIDEKHHEYFATVRDGFVLVNIIAASYDKEVSESRYLQDYSSEEELCDIDRKNESADTHWYSVDDFATEDWDQ